MSNKATSDSRWAERFVRPLRVMAHSQVQLDIFLRNHHIPSKYVRRITRVEDVHGILTDQPIVLLPSWFMTRDADEILKIWLYRGGRTIKLDEKVVLGKTPLCQNDTDGDGNCHQCVNRDGCPWPNFPAR